MRPFSGRRGREFTLHLHHRWSTDVSSHDTLTCLFCNYMALLQVRNLHGHIFFLFWYIRLYANRSCYYLILANFLWLSIDNSNSEQVTYPSYYIQKSLANICYWIIFSRPAFAFQENSYLYTHSWFSPLGARRAHKGKLVFCFRWSRHRLLWCTIAWHCFACCRRGNIFQAHHLSPQELKKKRSTHSFCSCDCG